MTEAGIFEATLQREIENRQRLRSKRALGNAVENRRLQQSLSKATKSVAKKAAVKQTTKAVAKRAIPSLLGKAATALASFTPVGVIANAIINVFTTDSGLGDSGADAVARWNREVGVQEDIEEGKYSALPEAQTRTDKFHVWGTFISKNRSGEGCDVKAYWRTSYAVPGNVLLSENIVTASYGGKILDVSDGNLYAIRPISKTRWDERQLADDRTISIYGRSEEQPCLNTTGVSVGHSFKTVEILPQAGEPLDPDYPGSKIGGTTTVEPRPEIKPGEVKSPDTAPRPPLPNDDKRYAPVPTPSPNYTPNRSPSSDPQKNPEIDPNPQPNSNPNPNQPEPNQNDPDNTPTDKRPEPPNNLKTIPPPPIDNGVKKITNDPSPTNNPAPGQQPDNKPNQTKVDKCAGSCSAKGAGKTTKFLNEQFGGTGAAVTNIAQSANDLLFQNPLLQKIDATTTTSKTLLESSAFGLQKIQTFAETAWKATKADKIMQGVSVAMTIHNGMMLSNNLLQTVSEATNMTLNALGIRDETDAPIDIGAAIRDKIDAILTSLLGADQYAALTARIVKANRIYQAGINVLDTTYSLFDSARTVAELTAENTGKIGNALRESGAVYEDAYEEFLENVSPQNASMRRLEKFREGLESVENVFSTVNQVSSEVVEFKENVNQLDLEKQELETEITAQITTQETEKDTAKTQIQVSTDIAENDFDRFESPT